MAVASTVNSRLQLQFEVGYDLETNKAILKNKSFNNVKTDATTEQLLAVSVALVPLQQHELRSIHRNDTELITEQ